MGVATRWAAPMGLLVFLASWCVCFFSLLFSCVLARSADPAWVGQLPPALGAAATLFLLASSCVLAAGFRRWAVFLGAGFIGVQVALFYYVVDAALLDTHMGAGCVLLAGFHGLHTLVGVCGLVRGGRLWSIYWHVMGGSWLCVAWYLYW